jgi:zinc protease
VFQSPAGFPVHLYLLSNGHRVIIEDRPSDAISLRTFIGTGSINERPIYPSALYAPHGAPSGLAHLDEHCHFLTTENYPQKYQWTAKLSEYGADFNATTSSEVIQHELLFNREDLPQMLAMHAESVLRPRYQPDLIALEKTNVINEIGERHRFPEAKIYNKLCELLFDRPDFQTSGTLSDILGASVQDLTRFHQDWYTPTNMVTVLSGRVDPKATLLALDREFGSVPARPQTKTSAVNRLALPPGQVRHATVTDAQLNYGVVSLGFPAPPSNALKDRMAMQLLALWLGDGPLSLLEDALKTRQRLVTELGISYEPLKNAGWVHMTLHTQPHLVRQVAGQAMSQIEALRHAPPRPEQLDQLKARLMNSFESGLENGFGDLSPVEAGSMSLGSEAMAQSLPFYLSFREILNAITPQDIQRVAQTYLQPNRYAVVYGLPGNGAPLAPQETSLLLAGTPGAPQAATEEPSR